MASIGNRLQTATTQKLVLNNKMLLSLNMLHLSTIDMRERIQKELTENPFLESVSSYEQFEYNPSNNSNSTTDILEATADSNANSLSQYLLEQLNTNTSIDKSEIDIASIPSFPPGFVSSAIPLSS